MPFFLLFTIYFFKTRRFKPFVIFLILCLTIKEHLALISMMFGVYAFFQKRSLRWVIVPIMAGIVWAIFSFFVLSYFKEAYPSHAAGAWLVEDLRGRFFYSGTGVMASFKNGLLSSNALNSFTMSQIAVLLLLPIGVIIPLLGSTSYLCFPELVLNLLSDRPALFAATRHYNVVVACCLLIGMIEGIKILSKAGFVRKLKVDDGTAVLLASFFLLASTTMYFYVWWSFVG